MKKDGVVTTVCPGLMRTGSPENATFKGKHEAEYAWFSISDSVPGISMNADRAARQILSAVPAKLAAKVDALFPELSARVLSWLTALGQGAARRNNEMEPHTA